MLEEPYPDNLVTVPRVSGMQQEVMRNDEYTRTFIALDFRAGGNSAAQSRLPQDIPLARAGRRRRASPTALKGQLKPTDLVDGAGKPLGPPLPRRDRVTVVRPGSSALRFVITHSMTLHCGSTVL